MKDRVVLCAEEEEASVFGLYITVPPKGDDEIFGFPRRLSLSQNDTISAVKNAAKAKITPWVVVKNVFYSWNEQTWFGKGDSYTAGNGSVYRI